MIVSESTNQLEIAPLALFGYQIVLYEMVLSV